VPDLPFRRLNDAQLDRLSDDELIAYLRDARAHGDAEAATLALQVLVYGYIDIIAVRVRLNLRDAPNHVVEEITERVLVSAISSAFDGISVGEFRSWMHTIARRRIADYLRSKRVLEVPLAEEHPDDEGVHGVLVEAPDDSGAVLVQALIDQALGELGPPHRAVVELHVFQDGSAKETAEVINQHFPDLPRPMSENNVHQIGSRFRRRMRELLESDTGRPGR
jgi:RNA polymerase sigma factor (sigma-70 family)